MSSGFDEYWENYERLSEYEYLPISVYCPFCMKETSCKYHIDDPYQTPICLVCGNAIRDEYENYVRKHCPLCNHIVAIGLKDPEEKEMFCPNCGIDLAFAPIVLFCGICGAELEGIDICPRCGFNVGEFEERTRQQEELERKYVESLPRCPDCGRITTAEGALCTFCRDEDYYVEDTPWRLNNYYPPFRKED